MARARIRYRTVEFGDVDIHLRTLRDHQQFEDDDGEAERLGISSAAWPLFGLVWASGEVLARVMFEHEVSGLRILEVGCGIALTSLVLRHRQADITATDQHPEAAAYLRHNTDLNGMAPIPFVRTGWAEQHSGLGRFDLLVGSDLLYEAPQVELLASFLERHALPTSEVILVDPGRGLHARFSKRMVALGFSHCQSRPETGGYLAQPFKGQVLRYGRCAVR